MFRASSSTCYYKQFFLSVKVWLVARAICRKANLTYYPSLWNFLLVVVILSFLSGYLVFEVINHRKYLGIVAFVCS